MIEDSLLQRVDRIGDGIDFSIPCLSRCVSSLFVVCVTLLFSWERRQPVHVIVLSCFFVVIFESIRFVLLLVTFIMFRLAV